MIVTKFYCDICGSEISSLIKWKVIIDNDYNAFYNFERKDVCRDCTKKIHKGVKQIVKEIRKRNKEE